MVDECDDDDITEAGDDDEEVAGVPRNSGPAVVAMAAWCRAALWRFHSFLAGPRGQGRQGGEKGGGEEAVEGGRECGTP